MNQTKWDMDFSLSHFACIPKGPSGSAGKGKHREVLPLKNCLRASGLLEVPLQQTLESLAVTSLVQ